MLVMLMSMTFASCHDDSAREGTGAEASGNAETTAEELCGKWERRSVEGIYTLFITQEGTGKLVSYEHASSATEKFKYTITDKGVVVDWGKLRKETYYASLTVDGKYLVLDNESTIYVYKKMKQ